jgi:AraC-like DNA-binding protein
MNILDIPVTFSLRSAMGSEVEQQVHVPAGIPYDAVPGASVLFFSGPWGHILSQYIILESGIQVWDTQYEMQCAVELSSAINLPFIELHNSVKNSFVNQWENVPLLSDKGGQGGLSAGPYMNNTVLFPGKNSYRTTDLHFTPESLIPFANAYPILYKVVDQFENRKFAQIEKVLDHTKVTKSLLHQLVHPFERTPILPLHYTGKANEILYNSLELLEPSLINQPDDLSPAMREKAEALEAIIREKFSTALHLSGLTRQLASTVPYLQAAFKKRYGKTFHQYLTEHRIERAKDFLLDTNDDLNSIADLTHFVDGSHLGNVFKKFAGETPDEFRKYRRGSDLS